MDNAPYDMEALHPHIRDPDESRARAEAEALRDDRIKLGVELAEAKNTALYKFLMDRAEVERVEAMDAITQASAYDAIQIGALQNKILLYVTIKRWIDEQIEIGEAARRDSFRPALANY